MIIHKILSNILINSFILYLVIKYLKIGISISPPEALNCEMVLVLGIIFWLIYDIGLKIVKIITFPFSFLLGNIFVLLLNIIGIYLFILIVNNLNVGIHLEAISFSNIVLLSIILVVLNLIFKKF